MPTNIPSSAKAPTVHSAPGVLSASGLVQENPNQPGTVINQPTVRPAGLSRYMVDLTPAPGVLSAGAVQQLLPQLITLDRQGQAQITVVVLPDTERELSDLAPEWFNAWGVGHRKRDDGILILVNQARIAQGKTGNRMFVAVGSGVQGTLPDGRVGQLIRTYARPALNAADTETALLQLVPQLVAILQIEPITPAPTQVGGSEVILMAFLLFLVLAMMFGRGRGTSLFLPGLGGGLGGSMLGPWPPSDGGGWQSGGGGGGWDPGDFGGGSSDGGGAGD
jgi:uncharacterized protein